MERSGEERSGQAATISGQSKDGHALRVRSREHTITLSYSCHVLVQAFLWDFGTRNRVSPFFGLLIALTIRIISRTLIAAPFRRGGGIPSESG